VACPARENHARIQLYRIFCERFSYKDILISNFLTKEFFIIIF